LKIAFDVKRMKPGCALLQATHGCGNIASEFNPAHWLLHPTDDLLVYEVTPDQLERLILKVEEYHNDH